MVGNHLDADMWLLMMTMLMVMSMVMMASRMSWVPCLAPLRRLVWGLPKCCNVDQNGPGGEKLATM